MNITETFTTFTRHQGASTVIETDTLYPLDQLSAQYKKADRKARGVIRSQYAALANALNQTAGFKKWKPTI